MPDTSALVREARRLAAEAMEHHATASPDWMSDECQVLTKVNGEWRDIFELEYVQSCMNADFCEEAQNHLVPRLAAAVPALCDENDRLRADLERYERDHRAMQILRTQYVDVGVGWQNTGAAKHWVADGGEHRTTAGDPAEAIIAWREKQEKRDGQ